MAYTTAQKIDLCVLMDIPYGGSGYKSVDPVSGLLSVTSSATTVGDDAYDAFLADLLAQTSDEETWTKTKLAEYQAIASQTVTVSAVEGVANASYDPTLHRQNIADQIRKVLHYFKYQDILRKRSEGCGPFVSISR